MPRSRSRSRERNRRRSRSRSRDGRRRERERSRDRGDGRRRERERSRDRGDGRRRERERSRDRDRRRRSRSRSRDRRKDRSPDRRDSRRSDNYPNHKEKSQRDESRKGNDDSEPSKETDLFSFSAAQVADRLCEVYGSKSRMRVEFICECFADDVRILRLGNGAVTTNGLSKAKSHYESETEALKAEPSYRIFVETDSKADPTFAWDIYDMGKSPGLGPKGLIDINDTAVMALYRVLGNKITHIWVSSATDEMMRGGKDVLTGSLEWSQIQDILADNLGGARTHHYNNYGKNEDKMGLGIGTASQQLTW